MVTGLYTVKCIKKLMLTLKYILVKCYHYLLPYFSVFEVQYFPIKHSEKGHRTF